MQNFLNYNRVEPTKRDVLKRLRDYDEIYNIFDNKEASIQADRCVQCGDPYCLNACPLSNFIPYWLKKISGNDIEFAFKISNDSSPFPEIMGRVCPQDVLCEGNCTLDDGYGAITIGSIETYISETAFSQGLKPEIKATMSDKKVAVIGSGPAGLSAATFLLRSGIQVEIFERDDKAGGLLTYGIPSFKLEKHIIQRRVDWLIESGMKLHLNKNVGKDILFTEILEKFDAVFLGLGATGWNKAGIDNEKAKNVYSAMELLIDIQKFNFNPQHLKKINVTGKKVVVIGGGDTAMDCVRTSIREKASEVLCVYRRDETNMPGSKKEYLNSIEEGVEFIFNSSPKSINVDSSNSVKSLRLLKTKMGKPDESGRQRVEEIYGSDFEIEADIVIMALGFSMEKQDFLKTAGIDVDSKGVIIVNDEYRTSNSKVFAGGDCSRGADLVVTAARDGRDIARTIAKELLDK